ncbi:MAG: DNA primase [Patescibacteria group bacterium]
MEDNVAKIKERLDIVDLIGGYLKLQKAGINFKANCPFHNEKTPSFFVSPTRQIWHCFGCQLSGDHFKFLMQIEGLEFIEALRVLAKRTGVEIRGYDKELSGEKNKGCEISELASKFFEKQLWESESGKKALEYLKNRGLGIETIKEWRLGYAPNTWNSLKIFLKDAGFREEEIFKAGLTVKKQEDLSSKSYILSSNYYDRFRGRIMFPVADINSQVVGFTGRIFEEITGEVEAGKYINTPQTAIYDKSRILYGLDKAKIDIRKNDRAIVVEGNMDVIMSHQAGVKNVVASSGTALTGWHLRIIKRYTSNLDLCFDEDLAGETAAKRGIDLALSGGFNVGIINLQLPASSSQLSKVKDVADLVRVDSQEWFEVSKKNQSIIQFYLEKALARHDLKTALGKKNIAGEVLPVVKLIENKVEQAHWLDELSSKLKVGQKILAEMLAGMKPGVGIDFFKENQLASFEPTGRLVLEETLLALLFRMPGKLKEFFPAGSEEEFEIFQDRLYNNIFQRLKTGQVLFEVPLSYEDNLRLELVKFKSDQFFGDLEEKDLENEVGRLVKNLKKELILEKIKDLEIKIKEVKSQDEVPLLLKEVQKFSSKLVSL